MVKTDLYIDPETEAIVIRSVDENNEVIKSLPQIRLKLSDLQYAEQIDSAHAIEAIMRCIHFKRPSDNAQRCCYGTFTISQDDSAANWSSPNIEDLYIGGGGGQSSQSFALATVYDDYLACQPYPWTVSAVAIHAGGTGYQVGDILTAAGSTGTAATFTVTTISGGGSSGPITGVSVTAAGAYTVKPTTPNSATGGHGTSASLDLTFGGLVNIAKPYELRHSVTAERIGTVDLTYSSYGISDGLCTRTASDGTVNQSEMVIPVYHTGTSPDTQVTIIIADQPVGGTGVALSGTPLTWMDTNRAGRIWDEVG
jgi:hypothetical protein